MSELVAPVLVSAVLLIGALTVLVVLLRRRRAERRSAPPGSPARPQPVRSGQRARPHTERERDLPRRSDRSPVRPLSTPARERFLAAWAAAQSRRAQRPVLALCEADAIVERLLLECGYPVDDPRPAAQLLPAEQARVLDSYRAGHALEQCNDTSRSDPEQVAQGLRHLSLAFEGVVGAGAARSPRSSSRRPTSAQTGSGASS